MKAENRAALGRLIQGIVVMLFFMISGDSRGHVLEYPTLLIGALLLGNLADRAAKYDAMAKKSAEALKERANP
jgi:hypothetical protein